MKQCTALFAHSLDKLQTLETTKTYIKKRCKKCGYEEVLLHSQRTLFFNNIVTQKKKWASEDNAKELVQPLSKDGAVNDDFTEIYGYNPFDDRTKHTTPKIQGGLAE